MQNTADKGGLTPKPRARRKINLSGKFIVPKETLANTTHTLKITAL